MEILDRVRIEKINGNLEYYYNEASKFEDIKSWCPKRVKDFYDFEYFNQLVYGIFLENKFIGMITILEDKKSEINVILDSKYRGNGITTYALNKVKDEFYEDKNHDELYANVDPYNIELQELYKSLNFININKNSTEKIYVYNRYIDERRLA
jgi:RimJ/RimL family protein N-acetyltransferase